MIDDRLIVTVTGAPLRMMANVRVSKARDHHRVVIDAFLNLNLEDLVRQATTRW